MLFNWLFVHVLAFSSEKLMLVMFIVCAPMFCSTKSNVTASLFAVTVSELQFIGWPVLHLFSLLRNPMLNVPLTVSALIIPIIISRTQPYVSSKSMAAWPFGRISFFFLGVFVLLFFVI